MNHLTMTQILQYVDGTADYASQAQSTSHLAVCDLCRREVELHNKLLRAGRQNVHRTSSRFIESVMAKIAPQSRSSWATKILNNLANIFAMMLVLGIFGYALSSTSGFKVGENPEFSAVTKMFSDSYAKLKQSADVQTRQLSAKAGPTSNKTVKLFVFSLMALLALGVVDRFVLRRIIKTKL